MDKDLKDAIAIVSAIILVFTGFISVITLFTVNINFIILYCFNITMVIWVLSLHMKIMRKKEGKND